MLLPVMTLEIATALPLLEPIVPEFTSDSVPDVSEYVLEPK